MGLAEDASSLRDGGDDTENEHESVGHNKEVEAEIQRAPRDASEPYERINRRAPVEYHRAHGEEECGHYAHCHGFDKNGFDY